MGALFVLFLLVKERSEEKSSFCKQRFTISEVIVAAIMSFANAPHVYTSNIRNRTGHGACSM